MRLLDVLWELKAGYARQLPQGSWIQYTDGTLSLSTGAGGDSRITVGVHPDGDFWAAAGKRSFRRGSFGEVRRWLATVPRHPEAEVFSTTAPTLNYSPFGVL